jgi:hypothetical protein
MIKNLVIVSEKRIVNKSIYIRNRLKQWFMVNYSSHFSSQLIMLGRWKITYEPKMIHSKVDWANVDHCGCCGINNFKKIN